MSGSITFVPSVHFSPTHRRRVRTTIREEEPDIVAVELDEKRFDRLERAPHRDPFELAREMPLPAAATYQLLWTIQRTVIKLYGLDPETTDMETAIETAAELETTVALIDDPIDETVSALTDRVGIETLPKLLMRAQSMGPADHAQAMELMTQSFSEVRHGDDVEPAIEQMRTLLPEVAEVFIDQRDRSMARRLHALCQDGYDVVAVIGAGHHTGILRHLEDLKAHDNGSEETDGQPSEDGVDVVHEGTISDEEVTVPVRYPSRRVTRIPIE